MIEEKVTKYMVFGLVERKAKTGVWHVTSRTHGELLGVIAWYPPWRQYCFNPQAYCVFNGECLSTIIDFMKEIRNGVVNT